MALIWPAKDPNEVLDYRVDWTDRLAGDTIATSTFALVTAAGLTKDSESNSATAATVWLSGGTAGATAFLRNAITTAGGRTLEEEIALPINSGLVVEDGTGLANADSYISVADADAYCAAQGLAWAGEATAKEQALRRAFMALNSGWSFKGTRTLYRAQAGAWPRAGATDGEDNAISSDEVPVEVQRAQVELAVYELATPGGLTPLVVVAERVRAEQIGPLRIDYAAVPGTADANRPILTKVDDLLAGLLDGGSGNSLVGEAVRA